MKRNKGIKNKEIKRNRSSKDGIGLLTWVNAIWMSVTIFILLPIAIIKGCADDDNLENRGKESYSVVTKIRGVNDEIVDFEYKVGGRYYKFVREIVSDKKYRIGDTVKIIYDSIDNKNVMIKE